MNICKDCKNTGVKENGAPCYADVHLEFEKLSKEQRDVHTEHCCTAHGCKYGDEDCTITTFLRVQSHPCEQCLDAYSDDTKMVKLNQGLVKIPSQINFLKELMKFVWDIEHDNSLPPEYQILAHELRLQYERNYK